MVPLVGGEWAEVKTLVIGDIQEPVFEGGEWVVHSKNHSYFSRMIGIQPISAAGAGRNPCAAA